MSPFVDVADVGDLGDGAMMRATVGGRVLLLARVGDDYYAAEDRCPHMGGSLSHGHLVGTVVTCPRHGSQFDLATGRVVRWTRWTGITLALAKAFRSPRPVTVYGARSDSGRIQVDLEQS